MLDMKWRFRKMSKAELNQDPMEREFFEGESINTRLVRESIQNSLDAAISRFSGNQTTANNQPVKVRFALAGIHNPLPARVASKYFTGLAPHLDALNEIDDTIARRAAQGDLTRDNVPFMVIEDEGTVGLEGDWEQFDDSESETAKNNHFYWFFRNIGRSGKGESDNGSWGLGKWVFPDASHASAYIAVTRRYSDDETLLIGQSVLSKHTIDGQRHAPYGYFALAGDEGIALPLRRGEPDHASFINQCVADFGLQYRNNPGLSVIVPFPRISGEEAYIETSEMIASIVHNYFYPIINGKLEVTVDEGDGRPVRISADTIDDILYKAELDESGERSVDAYRGLFEMCRQIGQLRQEDYIDISDSNISQLGNDYPGIAGLRRRYNAYELLAFRISTDTQRKNESRKKTEFYLYVQRDDSLDAGHDYYVRGTLSISEMNYLGQIRARSLLVVEETEPLAAMLRDSEPPAHTHWRPQVHRVTSRWVAAPRRITAVRYAPRNVARAMETPVEELQKDAFADIFSYQSPDSKPGKGKKNGGGNGGPPGVPTRQDFQVQDTQSGTGFRVRVAAGSENPPLIARLRVAYEAPRGNPLNLYSPNDFRLRGANSLNVNMRGCREITPIPNGDETPNELLLRIDDPDRFWLTVQGFDRNRDVYVRVERVSDMAFGEGGADE